MDRTIETPADTTLTQPVVDERPLTRMVRQAVLAGSRHLPPIKALIVSQLTGRRPAWPRRGA